MQTWVPAAGALLALAASPASGQATRAAAPAALRLGGEAALLVFQLKPDGADGFEGAVARLRDALLTSSEPRRRDLATSWTFYRVEAADPAPAPLVVSLASPVQSETDYGLARLFRGERPEEAAAFADTVTASLQGVSRLNLSAVLDFRSPGPEPSAPSQAPPAARPAASARPFTFSGDAALVTFEVKPERVADFERVMGLLHERVRDAGTDVQRRQVSGWRLFRGASPAAAKTRTYVLWIDPVASGVDVRPSRLLAELAPAESVELVRAYRESFVAISQASLVRLPRPQAARP